MSTEKRYKGPRIALKNPKDARRLIRRALAAIFAQKAEVEHAGKIANLLNVWLKAWELDEYIELERDVTKLREAIQGLEEGGAHKRNF
jgi:hypothetical protein